MRRERWRRHGYAGASDSAVFGGRGFFPEMPRKPSVREGPFPKKGARADNHQAIPDGLSPARALLVEAQNPPSAGSFADQLPEPVNRVQGGEKESKKRWNRTPRRDKRMSPWSRIEFPASAPIPFQAPVTVPQAV